MYQVNNWSEHFEGAKSKTYKNKTSCQMPTKHGLGYRKLIRAKNGPAMFGAWCALVQVLSRHQSPRHGYLTDTGSSDGIPLVSDDLELLTDIPAKVFSEMLQVCASERIGWVTDTTRILDGYHADTLVPLDLDSDLDLDLDLDSDLDSCRFDEFWKLYPVKKGKANAEKKWTLKKCDVIAPEIMADVEARIAREWDMSQKQYIPHPATYLNGERWNDEVTERSKPQAYGKPTQVIREMPTDAEYSASETVKRDENGVVIF